MMNESACEHLYKRHGRKVILRDINMTFADGAITLICGPNGAGKSTLLRIIAGLAAPSSGKVSLRENTRIGYLAHATFIYPALTALENLQFHARTHGADHRTEHLLAILDRMNLRPNAYEYARVFSRGMAQRLNFARIMATRANFLLLDEPFTGLDTASGELMRAEIARCKKENCAILMVSHEIAKDLPLADNVLALKNGKQTWQGRAAEYKYNGDAAQ